MHLMEELAELESAEEFLDYFGITYEPAVVHVNRLHILQRFHEYLRSVPADVEEEGLREQLGALLGKAYADFVNSDAQTEKVFRIFQQGGPTTTFVPLDRIGRGGSA